MSDEATIESGNDARPDSAQFVAWLLRQSRLLKERGPATGDNDDGHDFMVSDFLESMAAWIKDSRRQFGSSLSFSDLRDLVLAGLEYE